MSDTENNQEKENSQEPAVDGRFRLKISHDKLAVYMEGLQVPSGGGSAVNSKQVHDKLKKLDVKYGIKNKKIDAILAELNEGRLPSSERPTQTGINAGECSEQLEEDKSHLCIVKGDAPVHGQHALLQWHIDEEKVQDYVVLPGELIAIYSPPTQGEAGKSIYGKAVNTQPGRDDMIKPGEGIDQVKVDANIEYRSKWFGTIQVECNTIAVSCPLKISDDNMSVTVDLFLPSSASQPLEFDHIIKTLQQHKIIFGIKEEVLTDALVMLNESRQPVSGLVVAEGTPVVHGCDAWFKWNIDYDENTERDYVMRSGVLIATRGLATTGEAGKDIHGNVTPATSGKDIAIQIEGNIVEDENSHEFHSSTLGMLVCKTNEDVIQLSIDPGLKVTNDAMEARLNLFKKSADGTAIELADITSLLEVSGIKYGIDEAAITEALESIGEDSSGCQDVLVAKAKLPRDGVDSEIVYTQAENIAGEKLAKGRIDFHEHNHLWNFKKDDIIAHVTKVGDEEDGVNVWGGAIKAVPPNEMRLELEGAHLNDRNKIIADVDGTLIINGTHLSLTDLSIVEGDVSQETGNIHSTNGVHVKGHVLAGFVLESEKSILIDKNVEDASVRAGRDIVVKGGIRGLKSEVYTPGEVSAGFIENADVFVNGNITVTGSIINSKVSSNNAITVGSKQSRHNAIIGGRITAQTMIEAFVLGSSACHETIVSVGFTQEAKQQQRDLKEAIEIKEGETSHLDQIKTHFKLHPKADSDEVIRKANITQEVIKNDLESLEQQLSKVMEQIKQFENVRVVVHKKIFPGVVIKINEYTYEVNRNLGGGSFILENDKIIFRPK